MTSIPTSISDTTSHPSPLLLAKRPRRETAYGEGNSLALWELVFSATTPYPFNTM